MIYGELELGIVMAFFAVMVVAVYTDMTSNTVPNWLTYGGIAVGLILNTANPKLGLTQGLSFSAGGFAVGFCTFLVLYALGMISGGDVKLMGAIGALTGWKFTIQVIFYTAIVGGLVAMAVLAYHGLRRIVQEDGGDPGKIEPVVPIVQVTGPEGIPITAAAPVSTPQTKTSTTTDEQQDPAENTAAAEEEPNPNGGEQEADVEEAPSTIPYGVCIAVGGFVAFYLQPPLFT